ncbi:MAG: flavoprotein [Romboutsia sp.]|uniref:flavoprotein n=1 Tax=Romboutsia sp. TaxID=1965302 RepID=UPI003F40E4AF
MDIKKLENIIEESIESVFIDYLVNKVIEKLDNYNKKAIVIFTGASIGFEKSFQGIKNLQSDGWKFNIVLSKGACNIFNENLIKELFNIDKVIKENNEENLTKLIKENTIIIVPTLTVNTCSKIVNGISDSIATNIISYSLMSGKKVLVSINGCCPDNEERLRTLGDNMTRGHKELLRNNIEKLRSYGVILTKSENIEKKTKRVYEENFSLFKANKNYNNNHLNKEIQCDLNISNLSEDEIFLDKKVISKMDVYSLKNYKCIKTNKNSIITALAKEEALRHNVKILKI